MDEKDQNIRDLQLQIEVMHAKHETLRIQHQAEMMDLKDEAAKDLQEAVANYEAIVQELSNQIQSPFNSI